MRVLTLKYASAHAAATNGALELKVLPPELRELTEELRATLDWPLAKCCKEGRLNSVYIQIMRGANIHAQDDEALRLAARNGHLKVVELLLANKANIHAEDDRGNEFTFLPVAGISVA